MRVDTNPEKAGVGKDNKDKDNIKSVCNLISNGGNHDQVTFADENHHDLHGTPDQPNYQKLRPILREKQVSICYKMRQPHQNRSQFNF